MKITTLIIAIAALFLGISAKAQIFGGGAVITGTTNSSNFYTNTAYMVLPSKTIQLSSISNTNETIIVNYQIQDTFSNGYYTIYSFTNSFAAGTNSGSWTTNLTPNSAAATLPLRMQIAIGAYTNTVYVP